MEKELSVKKNERIKCLKEFLFFIFFIVGNTIAVTIILLPDKGEKLQENNLPFSLNIIGLLIVLILIGYAIRCLFNYIILKKTSLYNITGAFCIMATGLVFSMYNSFESKATFSTVQIANSTEQPKLVSNYDIENNPNYCFIRKDDKNAIWLKKDQSFTSGDVKSVCIEPKKNKVMSFQGNNQTSNEKVNPFYIIVFITTLAAAIYIRILQKIRT